VEVITVRVEKDGIAVATAHIVETGRDGTSSSSMYKAAFTMIDGLNVDAAKSDFFAPYDASVWDIIYRALR
jgi:urease gamma subunit